MSQELRIDTGNIRLLRAFVDSGRELLASIEQFAQLRVVIDVNFVISDLLLKIKYPGRGKTALEELVHSSVLEIFAPRWLEKELPSAFQQVAKKRRVTETDLWSAWEDYQVLIKWDETYDRVPKEFATTDDPKDLPYVYLQKTIDAIGILSKDGDIERMGGNRLTVDFVLATRSYARAAAISVGIRVSGRYLGAIAIGGLLQLIGTAQRSLERLPPKLKLALFGVVIIAILHPGSRFWITAQLKKLGPVADFLLEGMLMLSTIEAQKREAAETHLACAYAAANRNT